MTHLLSHIHRVMYQALPAEQLTVHAAILGGHIVSILLYTRVLRALMTHLLSHTHRVMYQALAAEQLTVHAAILGGHIASPRPSDPSPLTHTARDVSSARRGTAD